MAGTPGASGSAGSTEAQVPLVRAVAGASNAARTRMRYRSSLSPELRNVSTAVVLPPVRRSLASASGETTSAGGAAVVTCRTFEIGERLPRSSTAASAML